VKERLISFHPDLKKRRLSSMITFQRDGFQVLGKVNPGRRSTFQRSRLRIYNTHMKRIYNRKNFKELKKK
jgi:hypothetical protein